MIGQPLGGRDAEVARVGPALEEIVAAMIPLHSNSATIHPADCARLRGWVFTPVPWSWNPARFLGPGEHHNAARRAGHSKMLHQERGWVYSVSHETIRGCSKDGRHAAS